MRLICQILDKSVWTSDLIARPSLEPSLFNEAFPCLIYSSQKTAYEFKIKAASKLIGTGCQFVVCGGIECEQWHDAVDESISSAALIGEDVSSSKIMTTWHAEESVDELAFFFIYTTFRSGKDNQPSFFELDSTNYLVLQVGQSPESAKLLKSMCGYLKHTLP